MRDRDDDRGRGRDDRDRDYGRGRDDRGRDDRGSRDRDDRGGRDRDRDDRGARGRGDDSRGGRDRDRDDRGARGRGDDSRGGRDRDRDDRGGRDRERGGGGRDYVYEPRTAEDVDERATKGGGDYDKLLKPGTKMYKVRDGENRIRIVPKTWKGEPRHYGIDVFVHYGVGPDRASYICPRKHGGKPCPICEERDTIRGGSEADEKYAKDLEAKRRVLIYLGDREAEREGLQAWFMPWTVDRDISIISKDKDSGEVLNVDDPERGYDVMFDKRGQKDRTKYEGIQIARRDSPIGRREWLEDAMDRPLPDQLLIYDYDTIAKAFGAGGRGRGRDDRDDRDRGRDDRDDRGGRDRDRDYGGRDRDDRGRDDPPPRRDRGRDEPPTWRSVHAMTRTELEDLVELERLHAVKPREAKDDDDLADWVCEELGLKREADRDDRGGRDRDRDPPARDERDRDPPARDREPDPDDRLRDMRRRRAD